MPPADVPDGPRAEVARAGQQLVEQLLRLGIEGFGPFNSARESAQEALKGRTSEQAIKVLIRSGSGSGVHGHDLVLQPHLR